jgi:hypothetical protein
MMQVKGKSSLVDKLLDAESNKQSLMPCICDDCYDILIKAIIDVGDNNMVAVHCPHHMVLVEIDIADSMPLGVTATGPITQDEANAKVNE